MRRLRCLVARHTWQSGINSEGQPFEKCTQPGYGRYRYPDDGSRYNSPGYSAPPIDPSIGGGHQRRTGLSEGVCEHGEVLTADQRASFAVNGLVKLPAAVDPDHARQMCDEVWAFLTAEQGISRDDSSTWTDARPTGFNSLSRRGSLDRVWSPTVQGVLADLIGEDHQRRERPRVLMTFPEPNRTWDVPSDAWHFDFTPLQERPGLRAVQVFVLLSDVHPQGGGTLVLSGSHQLVSRYVARTKQTPKPKLIRGDLSGRHPWLSELWGRRRNGPDGAGDRAAGLLGVPAVIDGVELRVTEVTGDSGDVYVMNSDCFHAIAPNTLGVARVMCTSLVTRSLPSRSTG